MKKIFQRENFILSLMIFSAIFLFSYKVSNAFTNPTQNPTGGVGSISIEASTPANTFYLKSNGNVGVGQTNPTEKLDVNGDVYIVGSGTTIGGATLANGWLKVGSSLAMDNNEIYFGTTGYFGTIGAYDLSINTNGSMKMLITSGGNVGIGKTPTTLLDVNGTVKAVAFEGPLSGSISAANVSAGNFGANTGGGNYSFPANVGIGTTSPSAKLHVNNPTGLYLTGINTSGNGANNATIIAQDYSQWIWQTATNWGVFWAGNDGAAYGRAPATNPNEIVFVGAGNTRASIDLDDGMMYVAGNVGVGTATPGAKLEVVGSTLTTRESVSYYKNLVHYGTTTPTMTGTLKVTFPKLWSATMMKMKIEGYNYNGGSRGTSWSVVVTGYNYSTGQVWVNYSAEISGAAPFNSVRLASDGTKNVVLLGTTASTWNYPQIAVTEFMGGYNSYTGWDSGWTISFITDETGITGVVTPVIDVFRNTSGNVGIGTVTPTEKLEVNGTVKATAFSGPLSGTITAANVSSGNFGANTGGGNYSFPANVGIGTTSPTVRLEVQSVAGGVMAPTALFGGNGGNASITINSAAAANYAYQTYAQGGVGKWEMGATGGNGDFYLNPTVQNGYNGATFFISRGGNIGLSNTAPAYKLDVTGDIHATGWLRTDGTQGWYSQTYGGGWHMQDTTWLRTYNAKSIWTSTGVLGSDGGLTIGYGGIATPAGGAIIAGNVGIGNTAPGYKLDVTGDMRASGKVLWGDGSTRTDTKDDAGALASKSGFFQTSAPVNYYAGASSWQHMIEARHSNDANNYAMQIAGSFFDQNVYVRKTNNSATTAWRQVVTSDMAGNTDTCRLVYYSGGATACAAGFYTWSGSASPSGYMLCCRVSNPI